MLCVGIDFRDCTVQVHNVYHDLHYSFVKSVELQFGFSFPLCPIIQSSDFDPMAMFSHISECSL